RFCGRALYPREWRANPQPQDQAPRYPQPLRQADRRALQGLGCFGLNLFGIEARLALGPALRCGGGFAERLEQHLAAPRPDMRQGGGPAEGRGQPWARPGPKKSLVKKAVRGKAVELLLGEIVSCYAEQPAHEVLKALQRGSARHAVAQPAQFAIGEVLLANRGLIVKVARPQLEGIAAAQSNIEPTFDEQLLRFSEASELAQLRDSQRCSSGLGHNSAP